MYTLKLLPQAEDDLRALKRNEPKSFAKAEKLLEELMLHPTTGTGHPHQLSGDRAGQLARSITKKHRLVYLI